MIEEIAQNFSSKNQANEITSKNILKGIEMDGLMSV
jgi:hypothetical protein